MGYKFVIAAFFLIAVSCKKPASFEYRDMKNFRISNVGVEKSTVSMELVYFNPNKFGVDLRHVDCDIYLDKNFVGKFILDTMMHIDRTSEFSLPTHMDVDMRNVFKNALNLLFSKDVLVGAKGTTRVGKGGIFITVPFNYEGRHKVEMF